jgi:copper resistance protein C
VHDHPLPAPGLRPVAGVLTALLLAIATLLPVGPAVAHDQLSSSDPADGAVLEEAPAAVVLTFSADQLPVGAAVVVRDASGADRADGVPSVSGPTVTQALEAGLPAGTYAVQWRSVAGDGHPVEGAFSFEVVGGDGAPPAEDAAAGDAPDVGETAAGEAQPTPAADVAGPAEPGADAAGASSMLPWAVGLAAAALVATGLVLALRRSRPVAGAGAR